MILCDWLLIVALVKKNAEEFHKVSKDLKNKYRCSYYKVRRYLFGLFQSLYMSNGYYLHWLSNSFIIIFSAIHNGLFAIMLSCY